MKENKSIIILSVIVLLLLGVLGGMVWGMTHYVIVDFKFYPSNASSLDLRGEDISAEHYRKLSALLPDCDIDWNIPFQGQQYPRTTDALTVTTLSSSDVVELGYFPNLRVLNADDCTNYPEIALVKQSYPELLVNCLVSLGSRKYDSNADRLNISDLHAEELSRLDCFTSLSSVEAEGGDLEVLNQLRDYCLARGIQFSPVVNGTTIALDATELTLDQFSEANLSLLAMLPQLKTLHLTNPTASAESLIAYRSAHPNLTMDWSFVIGGITISQDAEEIDLSTATLTSIEEVENLMSYFPDSPQVYLGECNLDNDALAEFRDRVRDRYKVVWMVRFTKKFAKRTDVKDFFPSRDGQYHFDDKEAYNLRYCEDIVCMDIGHMTVKDTSWLANMPNLEYLILAHTQVQYIDAISNCKKLKYLELDWSCIRDISPLVGCTALEDLNIGLTWPPIEPILGMTWLKNLYMIKGNSGDAWKATQALPNTRVVASGEFTVASGWRNLPNYYAMRDYLGVPYMN